MLRFARNDTLICHCEERSDEANSYRGEQMNQLLDRSAAPGKRRYCLDDCDLDDVILYLSPSRLRDELVRARAEGRGSPKGAYDSGRSIVYLTEDQVDAVLEHLRDLNEEMSSEPMRFRIRQLIDVFRR